MNTEYHTHTGGSSSNPGSVICCFQPAALLSERLMDFKRVKNDDHPHKWACQIQDRVLEQHFKQGDYLFQSAGGNMNICCCVNHTAVLSCIEEKGKLEKCCSIAVYTDTARGVLFECVEWRWRSNSVTSHLVLETIGDVQTKLRFNDDNESDLVLIISQKRAHCRSDFMQVKLSNMLIYWIRQVQYFNNKHSLILKFLGLDH